MPGPESPQEQKSSPERKPLVFTNNEPNPVFQRKNEQRNRQEQNSRKKDSQDLADLEKTLESSVSDNETLIKAGLTPKIVENLDDHGIFVSAGFDSKTAYVDTSQVWHQVVDGDGFRAIKMSSLPLIGKTIDKVNVTSDGVTSFSLTDVDSGRKEVVVFSQNKVMPDYMKPSSFK